MAHVSTEFTPPRADSRHAQLSPAEFLLASSISRAVKRKSGHQITKDEQSHIQCDVPPYQEDRTIWDIHTRQQRMIGPTREKFRVLFQPEFLENMKSEIDSLRTVVWVL